VALYAIAGVNVIASLMEPAREFLLEFCIEPAEASTIKKPASSKKSDVTEKSSGTKVEEKSQETKKKKKQKKKSKTSDTDETKKDQ
jgi:hypothetical protein